jgi:predicted nucleic acid-binding protein
MVAPRHRVFFDTSVYIAALLSPEGASGKLLRLVEAGALMMVVSEKVVVESDQALSERFPNLIQESRKLWETLAPEIAPDPAPSTAVLFLKQLPPSDAAILCLAQTARVSAFVTWNTRDFMKPGIETLVSFPIVIPGDCLKLFRKWIAPFLE